jgi:pimeloyl-ACP methyl ester carboxylesterase
VVRHLAIHLKMALLKSSSAFLFPDVIQTIPSSIKVLGMVNLAAAPDFVSRDKLTLSGDALNLYAAALTPGASAEVYRQGMFAFPQFLWAHPEQVPHRKQMLALGVAMQAEADLVFPIMQARKQNATRFWEEGREGLPVLLIWGRKDNVFDAPKIEGVYRDHEWKKLDVLAVDDAGHAVHDDGGKVASYHIMEFVLRVALA